MAAQGSHAPASAVLVAWGNAWTAGHCGLDEVVDALEREHGPQVVTGLPGPADDLPLRHALGELRAGGLTAFRLALPIPGDPLGLTGPAAFNEAAVDAGEAVLVDVPAVPLGLVPGADDRGSSYAGTSWTAYRVAPTAPQTPTLAEAEQALALTLRSTADLLLDLDVAASGPAADEALAGLRREPAGTDLAPGYPPRAHRVAAQAARLAAISRVGLADDGGAITSREADARRSALRDLERAVRRARVAAHNSVAENRSS
ncbi:MAG: hypothetical protein J2P24_13225 [Streptosporangiales bacterium]|nr:hypothetical protein [Streptosporangiales bacterium]MBO0890069.1 hypothetical protein [Acidothermales bacterium]